MNKDFPKYQWSIFVGSNRNEQYVVRGNDLNRFRENIAEVKDLIGEQEEEDIADKVTCPIHKVPMQHFVKEGNEWWSHQTENGWCSGKANQKNRLL